LAKASAPTSQRFTSVLFFGLLPRQGLQASWRDNNGMWESSRSLDRSLESWMLIQPLPKLPRNVRYMRPELEFPQKLDYSTGSSSQVYFGHAEAASRVRPAQPSGFGCRSGAQGEVGFPTSRRDRRHPRCRRAAASDAAAAAAAAGVAASIVVLTRASHYLLPSIHGPRLPAANRGQQRVICSLVS